MKTWAYIAIAAAFLGIVAFRKRGEGQYADTGIPGEGVQKPSMAEIKDSLAGIVRDFGRPIAENVERIYRLESNDFRSGQFLATNTAGQRAFGDAYPFGWKRRGTVPGDYAPVARMAENAGGPLVSWVAFKRFDKAARYLAQVMKERGNDPGKWHTLEGTPSYRAAVAAFTPSIVNSI